MGEGRAVEGGGVNPGALVKPKWGDLHMYGSVGDHHRVYKGAFLFGSLGIVLDAGFSPTDVYYYQVFVDGKVGWVRAEWVGVVG